MPRILPALLRDPETAKAEPVMRAMPAMVKIHITALRAAYNAEPPG